jgi:hypothetical protein
MRLLDLLLLGCVATGCGGDRSSPDVPKDVISLDLGGVRDVALAAAAPMHIGGGSAGAEFTLIAQYPAPSPTAGISLTISGDHLTPVVGPPSPLILGPTPGALRDLRMRESRGTLQSSLNQRAAAALASRIGAEKARTDAARVPPFSTMAVPTVGTEMTLNVSLDACGTPALHAGRVVVVSDHLIIVEDEANPPGGYSADDYASIANEYETFALPVLKENFGDPTDIDGNGRVIALVTRAVNELNPAGSPAISSFYYARDLVPKTGSLSCAGSNEAELIYLMTPDPGGTINQNVIDAANARRKASGDLPHAFVHMVDYGNRLVVQQTTAFEDLGVLEGLADIAEELLFYKASGLGPRQNITSEVLLASSARKDAFNLYVANDLGRLGAYLMSTESTGPMGGETVASSGAAWEFLRYLADRSSVPEATVWRGVVSSTLRGAATLAAATQLDIAAAERDWATAQYTDDAGLPVTMVLTLASWNFRSIFPALKNPISLPLATHDLSTSSPLSLHMNEGGASYIRLAVPAGQISSLTVSTIATGVQAAGLSLRLVRTK